MLSGTRLDRGAFVAVDIETTGSRPGIHSIIEIGAVRIEGGRLVASFAALVAPNDPVPPAVEALTGITREILLGAVALPEALEAFRDFAEGAVLIAHNHRFDLGFLDYESEVMWGRAFPRPVLDTLSLANRLHPEDDRHNLRDLAARYATSSTPTHRALADARAAGEVFLAMTPALEARGLRTAADVAAFCGMAGQGSLAKALPLTTRLPDARGVYVFRDAEGRVVHVGRAKNLRIKVRS
ncbi:MAG: endonuclease, partial [Actinobacteria bacterium]